MINHQYAEQIARYLSGNIGEEEASTLMEWVKADATNQAYFEECKALWELSNNYDDTFESDVPAAWEKVARRINEPRLSSVKSEPRSIVKHIWLRAAVILFLVVAGFMIAQFLKIEQPAELAYHTQTEEQIRVDLPDGSTVWLNENSKLSYLPSFQERIVQLEGEAFFEVARDEQHPFEIIAANSKTVVLGTTFNVRAYPNEEEVAVTVKSGKVVLRPINKTDKAILLEAGESGEVERSTAQVSKKAEQQVNADAWKTKRLAFEDVPLREVIPTLERYFNLEINVQNEALLNCHINGTYEQPDIEQIMKVFQFILEIDVQQNQKQYLLNGEGCE